MTDKEQIEKMGIDICKGCNSRLDPDFECNRNVCTMAEIVSEYLIDKGWTKTVWHKVADGDLPKKYKEVVVFLDVNYDYYIGLYAKNDETFHTYIGFDMDKSNVIAWMGLPKYEE